MSYIYDYQYLEYDNSNTSNIKNIDVIALSYKNIEQKRFSDSRETEQLLNMLNNEE
jgi:hypothetical protein